MDPAEFGISTLPLQHHPYAAISSEALANTNVGKVAVITGAARGIGAAIAESIAKTGADVALLDLTIESQNGTKAACEKAGVKVKEYGCDVANLENVRSVFEHVERDLGPIE
jgi:NAD(P)-dependent dehydrogenase (short-subunit alcohol dehydrogenase family)